MNHPDKHIAKCFGYQFDDLSLLKLALTHRSAAKQHNERLEFLGDAVLGMVVADWLYEHFPRESEGKLTRMRASLVKGVTLAQIAQEASG
jgi:ribonuclease-3